MGNYFTTKKGIKWPVFEHSGHHFSEGHTGTKMRFFIALFAIGATLAQVSWVGYWFANRSLPFSKLFLKNRLVCFNRTVRHALSPSNAQMGRWCAHPCPSHLRVPHVQHQMAARTSSAPTSGAKTIQVSNFDYKMLLIFQMFMWMFELP